MEFDPSSHVLSLVRTTEHAQKAALHVHDVARTKQRNAAIGKHNMLLKEECNRF